MEEQTESFPDSRLARENQQINPIEKNRRPTDKLFIFVFLLITIAWFGIAISALCAQQHVNTNAQSAHTLLNLKKIINAPVERFSGKLAVGYLIMLFFSTLLSLGCIFVSEKNTKCIVYAGVGMYLLGTIYYLFQHIRYNKEGYNLHRETSIVVKMFIDIIGSVSYTVTIIFMIPSVACFVQIDQNVLRDITKNMSRVIIRTPIVIIFAGFITVLKCLVFFFTVNAAISDLMSDRSMYRTVPETIILILGGICVMNFLYNLAFIVVSEYSVNYYWKNDGTGVFILCVSHILRNHLGTVMLSSTLCIPHICAIFQALKHKPSWKNAENYSHYFISKVSLVLSMDCIALIYSSIYGTGFIKSSKKTFDTVLRRSTLYLATLGVIDALIIVIMMIVTITAVILHELMGKRSALGFGVDSNTKLSPRESRSEESIDKETLMMFALFGYSFMVPLLTYGLLINSSAKALLFNKIISFNKEEQEAEGSAEGKTNILNHL